MEEKAVEYGRWYECKRGTMPEDILGYESFLESDFTPDVLVLFYGCVTSKDGYPTYTSYLSNRRIRSKGHKAFHWHIKCDSLVWCAVAPTPHLEVDDINIKEYLIDFNERKEE